MFWKLAWRKILKISEFRHFQKDNILMISGPLIEKKSNNRRNKVPIKNQLQDSRYHGTEHFWSKSTSDNWKTKG